MLNGARAAYLVVPPEVRAIEGFIDEATRAGVDRIVLLSARGPDQSGDRHLLDTEAAVVAGAATWAVLRPSWFNQNFSEGFFRPALESGELRIPAGDGREPFIDADDIADAAVVALTGDTAHDRVYELSGPEPLSFGDAVSTLSRSLGRPLRYVPVDTDEFLAEQSRHGMPDEAAHALANLFSAIRHGENDFVSDGVPTLLGRGAASFDDFAAEAASRW